MERVKAAVIYYSATGTVHELARAAVEGAEQAGADVRLRRVPELAPREAIKANPDWNRHVAETADVVQASLEDVAWADVILFGTPARFGNPAAQLKSFIETTGPLWQQGRLADKVCTAFTSASTAHGGQEATLLALGNVFYHWGCYIVPPGYTDPVQFRSGNPYGTSHTVSSGPPDDVALDAARYQARRAVRVATALKAGAVVAEERAAGARA
jgi:NAD(P)H dehydrogenase (quinone)